MGFPSGVSQEGSPVGVHQVGVPMRGSQGECSQDRFHRWDSPLACTQERVPWRGSPGRGSPGRGPQAEVPRCVPGSGSPNDVPRWCSKIPRMSPWSSLLLGFPQTVFPSWSPMGDSPLRIPKTGPRMVFQTWSIVGFQNFPQRASYSAFLRWVFPELYSG